MGKSRSTTTVTQTPEQQAALRAQTDALTETFLPAYKKTLGMADTVYEKTAPAAIEAANRASDVATKTGNLQGAVGAGSLLTGATGLADLFSPDYEEGQVQSALQAGRESARESQMGQNAMYGAAGGLGSSRMALADRNLSSLNAQRQATAAADARAKVQANKAMAANALLTAGKENLTDANKAASATVGYAQTPQDIVAKYAQGSDGTPRASTTPNFSNTQSSNSSSKGFRL
jgi:hypothetical protein